MKRFIISLFLMFATWQAAFAMSYERAREEALYLTDKMAYELNLNDQQYNDAYEINLDYFLALDSEADLYADYLSYRLSDLRHILYDWQYNLLLAADYFIRPVYWRSGGWYFPIYAHYSIGYYYYSYPTVYYSYRGGHGRIHHHTGFYASRRPVWNGGLRGHQPIGGRLDRLGHSSVHHNGNGRIGGNGYRYGGSRRGYERSDRGNSFGNSSSRNHRNDYSGNRGFEGDHNTSNNRPDNMGTENHDRSVNSNVTNRNSDATRNHDISNRNHDGIDRNNGGSFSSNPSRGDMNNFHNSRPNGDYNSSRGNSSYGGSRSGGYNGSRGSGSFGGSRGGGYNGSRGSGSFGGSRGGNSGGSKSGGSRGGFSSGRR